MNTKLIVLTFFIVAISTLGIIQTNTAGDKVRIDFYFESLCPFCQDYIQKSLKIAASTKDFWKICDFNLYPYGNARRYQNGSTWSYTCQHGVRECQGNLIQTCAIKKYELYQYSLPFIICLEENSNDWISQGKKCASQLNMDWNAISTCATTAEGLNFQYQMAVATQKLIPAHTYVPWVVVNGQHSSTSQKGVITNMVQYVCSIYKGTEKIAACP